MRILLLLLAVSHAAAATLTLTTTSVTVSPGGTATLDGTIRNTGSDPIRLALASVSNQAPAATSLDPTFTALQLAPGATYQGHLLNITIPAATPIGTYGPLHLRLSFSDGTILEADIPLAVAAQSNLYRLPQIAAGHLWSTTIILANPTATNVDFTITFRGSDGSPLDVPFPALGTRRTITGTLLPYATQFFTADDGEPLTQGWAEIATTAKILVESTFRKTIDGRADWESGSGAIPPNTTKTILYFDNATLFTTSLAIANPNNAQQNLNLTFRDETGTTLGTATVTLAPHGQTTIRTPSQYPFTADHRGTIEFTANGQEIAILGLRFNSTGGVVALPQF